ncbi:hypothetical protein ACFYO0_40800 [Streptomyces sp. NPDC006365]|uniref:hypothetical protein n=1 Tax=Streptomyces sp. NPDC006365 TaxID=3364744 RepID=UPI00369BAE76
MAALRDLFHTSWHPTRHGGLSRLVMTALWRLPHRLWARRRVAGLVGPLAMVTVVGMWATTIRQEAAEEQCGATAAAACGVRA